MFNADARWDRPLPGHSPQGDEPVEVFAKFLSGKIIPLAFVINGTRYSIVRIHYAWSERKGRSALRYFSVADKKDTYCLCFDLEYMKWSLVAQSG